MHHSSCTPCCLPSLKVPKTMAIPPTLASHLQCVASQTFRLRPALSQADMRVTSTFLASSSKPVHQLASGHASDDLNADSSTGLPLQADQMQQQLQQQRVSQPPKKRGRKPKHALEDERAEALPGPDASPRRRRAGRRRTTEAAAGSESKRKPNLIRKPRANSVAAGSHDTPSNGGQTQSSAARPAQDHSIPVIPLPPPPVHAAARPGPGSEEATHVYDFTWRGDEELDDLDEDSSDDDEGVQGPGHGGGSAAQRLAAAADAARLSFGLPTKGWSARKQRRALERGQLPWGMSPCLQDEQLLNKAMQLVYSGGPREGSLDDPALAHVGWGNRISVRTSEGSGMLGHLGGDAQGAWLQPSLGNKGVPQTSEGMRAPGYHTEATGKGTASSSKSSSGGDGREGSAGAGSMLPCPPRFIGPVEVKPIPGKGWGLVATDIIEPGEAVLVSEPLIAACSTQSGQPPSPLVLLPWLQRLQRELSKDHPARVALHALWHGRVQEDSAADASSSSRKNTGGLRSASSNRNGVRDEESKSSGRDGKGQAGRALVQVPDIVSWELPPAEEKEGWQNEEKEDGGDDGRGLSGKGGRKQDSARAGGQVEKSGEGAEREELEEAELQGLLLHNVFGDGSEDPAAALCRGAGSHALIGIWPEFSLINHACLPNAMHMLLGGRMVVRATAPIMPNQEITVNYLGHAALAPYTARQEELQGIYGFSCSCTRCRVELGLLRDLGGTLEEVRLQNKASHGG
uniref:SET domain-containing protein n=1 Tax=Dunaliella tertiolecta TaxID=3047 RepID=A0A7S3R7L9_DUNTE